MAINFNTGPYFDDFDPTNNFYKILFKPGYAVQSRELNQLQSILQHQVAGVSNHVFKKNTMVIPGGISLDTSADIVFVAASSNLSDLSTLVGKTITNATSFDFTDDSTFDGFITAVVLGYRAADAVNEVPGCLYVKYFKTNSDGRVTFNTSEALSTVEGSPTTFTTDANFASGFGKVATISAGLFYTTDLFVDALGQSIIVEYDSNITTNCTIGLQIVESIVTSDDDEALLDNANGAPNQYAPGADRYKVELQLIRVDDANELNPDSFIVMMRLENNVITYINNKTEYSEIMKMLARRTYDANGNFIVDGLDISVNESSNSEYLWAKVSKGKAYLGGYEYEQIVDMPMVIRKPRDAAHTEAIGPVTKFADGLTEFYIAGGALLAELPAADALVQFLDAAPGTVGVSVIGTGVFKDIQYFNGSVGDNDIYKAFFDWVTLETGATINDIGGFVVVGASEGAPILHRLRIKGLTGTFAADNVIKSTTISAQTATVFDVINNSTLYVIKDTLNEVPNTEVIKINSTTTTATLTNSYVSNYIDVTASMIKVDDTVIKHISNVNYQEIRKEVFTPTLEDRSTTYGPLGTGETYEDYSTSDFYAYNVTTGEFISLADLITISGDFKSFTIDLGAEGEDVSPENTFDGDTIWIYATVNKTGASAASKTITEATDYIETPSRAYMALGNQDIFRIVKIVDAGSKNVTFTDTGDVVTILDDEGDPVAHGLANGASIIFPTITTTTGITENTIYYIRSINSTTFTLYDTRARAIAGGGTGLQALTTNGTGLALPQANINTDTDITSRYTFLSGNDYDFSGTGVIKLRKRATPPVGQIAVKYEYWDISETGSFVSVDSYGEFDNTDGIDGEADLTYIGQIKDIKDPRGNTIRTRNYIDYRPRTSSYFFKNYGKIANASDELTLRDLNLSICAADLVGKYVVGPGMEDGLEILSAALDGAGDTVLTLDGTATGNQRGTYFVGLISLTEDGSNLSIVDTAAGGRSFIYPKDSAQITYSYTRFTPRKVLIYANRVQDEIEIVQEEIDNINQALDLRRNEFKLPLVYIDMQPYTVNLNDVLIYNFDNPVYKMLDIHDLKLRLDRAEYYANLGLGQDLEESIIDANNENLDESRYGYWDENFLDVTNQAYDSADFKCTIYDRSYVSPGVVTRTINLQVDTQYQPGTWQSTKTAITLPYVEQLAFSNTRASKFNNLNPFNIIYYSGKLTLTPNVDNWIDTTISPRVIYVNNTNTLTNTVITDPIIIQDPPIIIVQPPPVLPPPPDEEVVIEITNLRTSWGPDSRGGRHAITFDWRTNLGRTGRVNSDYHLSKALIGVNNYNGTFARSLINRKYNDPDVKAYLHAGTHFDQKPPSQW